MNAKKPAIKILILGAAFSIIILLSTCWAMKLPGWYRMAQNPGIAEGIVVSKHPEDRNKVDYRFTLGDQTHTGRDGVGDEYDRIRPGDRVRVFYDPKDLSMLIDSALETFQVMMVLSLVFALVTGFPGAFVTVLIFDAVKSVISRKPSGETPLGW